MMDKKCVSYMLFLCFMGNQPGLPVVKCSVSVSFDQCSSSYSLSAANLANLAFVSKDIFLRHHFQTTVAI